MAVLHRYFDNGYGISVIDDGYGKEQGLFEITVLNSDGTIAKDTPITRDTHDDVIGWLTFSDVTAIAGRIAALPPREITETRTREITERGSEL